MERPQLHPEHQGSLCPVLPSSHKWNCRKSTLFHQKRLKGHADGYGSGVQTRLVSPLTLGPPFTKGGPHPQDLCQFSQTTPRPKPYSAWSVGGSPHPAHVGRDLKGLVSHLEAKADQAIIPMSSHWKKKEEYMPITTETATRVYVKKENPTGLLQAYTGPHK